jgi:hypothetical protein
MGQAQDVVACQRQDLVEARLQLLQPHFLGLPASHLLKWGWGWRKQRHNKQSWPPLVNQTLSPVILLCSQRGRL